MAQTPTSAFSEIAVDLGPQIEEALARYTQPREGCPAELSEAIRHSLLAPAKRLRPLLVLMASRACGGRLEAALPAACSVEMVHTYSLIHDDLPAMDDDDLRRGRPTNHKEFGEATAILAGDALLAMAFEVLSKEIHPAETAVACVATLATTAGPTALVGGQADDLAADALQADEVRDKLAFLEAIHSRKTGAMFLASLRLGGLVAGADETRLAALAEYGRNLGLAFQIVDDLLDVEGDETALGKRTGMDVNRGKLTFPGLLGVDESRRRAERTLDEACAALAHFGTQAEELAALARYVLERDR